MNAAAPDRPKWVTSGRMWLWIEEADSAIAPRLPDNSTNPGIQSTVLATKDTRCDTANQMTIRRIPTTVGKINPPALIQGIACEEVASNET